MLVKTRSMLVTHTRGLVKTQGYRIESCSAAAFATRLRAQMPEELAGVLSPMARAIEELTVEIRSYEKQIRALLEHKYPQSGKLQAVHGVGPITALAFLLSLEDPSRFQKSRDVGPFLGLVPRRDQSGEVERQLGITKAGNEDLRRLLVGSAHYILGAFGPDCDLRRFGLKLAEGGGKGAKRRAVVAVARKLAVLLHRLWISQEPYDPHYQQRSRQRKAA
jgi:transposase